MNLYDLYTLHSFPTITCFPSLEDILIRGGYVNSIHPL